MNKEEALDIISGSIGGFRDYSATIKSRVAAVRPDTTAERDEALSGSILFPSAIVSGLMIVAADQLGGWAEMAGGKKDTALLHMLADYTLFRPVIEALTEVIWILDGQNSKDRIERSIELARIELKHGRSLTQRLRRAGTPDKRIEASIDGLETQIKRTLARLKFSEEEIAKRLDPRTRTLDPSEITRKIGKVFKGPSLDLNRYWGITSAHAHGQLITILTFSLQDGTGSETDGFLHEPDEIVVAEILTLIQRLIRTATDLLNQRGYFLRA